MQSPIVLKLDDSGHYREIPIVVVPVIYNWKTEKYRPYTGQDLTNDEKIIER